MCIRDSDRLVYRTGLARHGPPDDRTLIEGLQPDRPGRHPIRLPRPALPDAVVGSSENHPPPDALSGDTLFTTTTRIWLRHSFLSETTGVRFLCEIIRGLWYNS